MENMLVASLAELIFKKRRHNLAFLMLTSNFQYTDGILMSFFFSMVVKGVVCKKNVAHRRMTSKIDKPRFLILGGALEYQRVANHLSSVDTLLQQVTNSLHFLSFGFLRL